MDNGSYLSFKNDNWNFLYIEKILSKANIYYYIIVASHYAQLSFPLIAKNLIFEKFASFDAAKNKIHSTLNNNNHKIIDKSFLTFT